MRDGIFRLLCGLLDSVIIFKSKRKGVFSLMRENCFGPFQCIVDEKISQTVAFTTWLYSSKSCGHTKYWIKKIRFWNHETRFSNFQTTWILENQHVRKRDKSSWDTLGRLKVNWIVFLPIIVKWLSLGGLHFWGFDDPLARLCLPSLEVRKKRLAYQWSSWLKMSTWRIRG